MRNFGGEILTHGLKRKTLKFISHDQNLRSAIESAYEHFLVAKRKPDFLLLSEKEQIKLAQQNIVNFYANENVNPYVAISAMGPWIVTLRLLYMIAVDMVCWGLVIHQSLLSMK